MITSRSLLRGALIVAAGLGCGNEDQRRPAAQAAQQPAVARPDSVWLAARAAKQAAFDSAMGGSVRLRAGGLEAVFPPVSLTALGCAQVDTVGPNQTRWYSWRVANYWLRASGHRELGDPFLAVDVGFGLPRNVALTARRLDSAFAVHPMTLRELRGEPPMVMRSRPLSRTTIRREAEGIRLTIGDTAAVRSFMAPGRQAVHLGWCQKVQGISSVSRPVLP